jgi:hypothetical protein
MIHPPGRKKWRRPTPLEQITNAAAPSIRQRVPSLTLFRDFVIFQTTLRDYLRVSVYNNLLPRNSWGRFG